MLGDANKCESLPAADVRPVTLRDRPRRLRVSGGEGPRIAGIGAARTPARTGRHTVTSGKKKPAGRKIAGKGDRRVRSGEPVRGPAGAGNRAVSVRHSYQRTPLRVSTRCARRRCDPQARPGLPAGKATPTRPCAARRTLRRSIGRQAIVARIRARTCP